ncbi:MAG: hypothetical protein RIR26_2363 [Pseudomonadota bacterium]
MSVDFFHPKGAPMRFIPTVLMRLFVSLSFLVFLAACSTEESVSDSALMSQVTQVWRFSAGSAPLSFLAESGKCAQNLPQSSLSQGYCFNEVPAAEITVSDVSNGTPAICVATHLAGTASDAAALIVDFNGNYVSEVSGNGSRQSIDVLRIGRHRVYVGFPNGAVGQKVTLRLALLSQFSLQAPACNLR